MRDPNSLSRSRLRDAVMDEMRGHDLKPRRGHDASCFSRFAPSTACAGRFGGAMEAAWGKLRNACPSRNLPHQILLYLGLSTPSTQRKAQAQGRSTSSVRYSTTAASLLHLGHGLSSYSPSLVHTLINYHLVRISFHQISRQNPLPRC